MLRAILAQAQRAHRILRDLMYVARPSEPRPRFCQPEEILRACLRDAKAEADVRGRPARRRAAPSPGPKSGPTPTRCGTWPRSCSATPWRPPPREGRSRSRPRGDAAALPGPSRTPAEGSPRPRASTCSTPSTADVRRAAGSDLACPAPPGSSSQAGGDLRWHSTPGQGTIFHVHLPLAAPPKPPVLAESETGPPGSRNDPPLPTP